MVHFGSPPEVIEAFFRLAKQRYGDPPTSGLMSEFNIRYDTVRNWKRARSTIPPRVFLKLMLLVTMDGLDIADTLEQAVEVGERMKLELTPDDVEDLKEDNAEAFERLKELDQPFLRD